MPHKDPVERAAYNKEYSAKNREKISAQKKAHYEKIAEQMKVYRAENKEEKSAYNKEYNQTPDGKKAYTMKNWKRSGMIGDLSFIYDNDYLNCRNCWVCNTEFSKCCDHSHTSDHSHQKE
jgi:hypothetical protein